MTKVIIATIIGLIAGAALVLAGLSFHSLESVELRPIPIETTETQEIQEVQIENTGEINENHLYESFWIENPTSGSQLLATLHFAPDANNAPLIFVILGGTDSNESLMDDQITEDLLSYGFTVAHFAPDGRGHSEGEEDYNGHISQDGMNAVLQYLITRDEIDPEKIGVISFSYGVTLASGAIARYDGDPEIQFYIDWEGPTLREYTTSGCPEEGEGQDNIDFEPCENEEFWSEREALYFLEEITVPYLRVQGENDHVQKDNEHAVLAINAATEGNSPWTRINLEDQNQTHTMEDQPEWIGKNGFDLVVDEFVLEMAEMWF